jgi:hypothetical protein
MRTEELTDAYWDRVAFLRSRDDQRCENCKEWPDVKKGFHVRVTLRNPLGPKTDPQNLGLYCYDCRPLRWSPGRAPRVDRRQLSLF